MNPPSFPLYVNNWLASARVSAMTPEQEGAYFRLLCYQWNSGAAQSIPDDPEALGMMSRLNGRWPACAARILACFDKVPGGLRNERLADCWKEAADFRQGQVDRANRRWHPTGKPTGKPAAKPGTCHGNATALPGQCSESESESESELHASRVTPARENDVAAPPGQRVPPTVEQAIALGAVAGIPAEFCRQWHKTMTDQDWKDNQGRACAFRWKNLLPTYWQTEQAHKRETRLAPGQKHRESTPLIIGGKEY